MLQLVATLSLSSTGADVKTTDGGSRMTVYLDPPLVLPHGTTCRLLRSTQWYDTPNVTTTMAGGNLMTFTEQPSGTARVITIPEGLYSLADIVESAQEAIVNLGSPVILKLVGDAATAKVSLQMTDPTSTATSFDWNFSVFNGVMSTLLGFSGSLTATAGLWYDGTARASLNQLNAYVFHGSFVGGGSNVFGGKGGSTVLDVVNITTTPGNQIRHEPYVPLEVHCHEGRIDQASIWVTSEDGITPTPTSEAVTILVEFRAPNAL